MVVPHGMILLEGFNGPKHLAPRQEGVEEPSDRVKPLGGVPSSHLTDLQIKGQRGPGRACADQVFSQ